MSERKRLTDGEVRVRRLDQGCRQTPAGEQAARELWTDHDQAREDVKRLAQRLRERLDGRCCEEARRQCEACVYDEALLSEVGQ